MPVLPRLVPSPAMAVALLALVVALGGTGYAAVQVTSKDIKNGTIKTKDLNATTVSSLRGSSGPAGPTGAPGTPGTPGVTGAAGSARAYAYVQAFGDFLVPARSKGVASVTRPSTGKYCLTLSDASIDPSALSAIVSPEWENSGGNDLAAYWVADFFGCPGGTDVVVQTYRLGTVGSPASDVDGVLSDDVSFAVLVP